MTNLRVKEKKKDDKEEDKKMLSDLQVQKKIYWSLKPKYTRRHVYGISAQKNSFERTN